MLCFVDGKVSDFVPNKSLYPTYFEGLQRKSEEGTLRLQTWNDSDGFWVRGPNGTRCEGEKTLKKLN